ncbi:MAG: RNA polymerase sigma factor [Granulosicoccus sp.]
MQHHLLDLLRQVVKKEASAFSEFYELTISCLYSTAFKVLKNHHDTEEAVCDSYLKIWNVASCYSVEQGSVLGWSIIIARSRALDRYRQRVRSQRLCSNFYSTLNAEFESYESVECDSMNMQSAQQLKLALNTLPSLHRELIKLSFYEGFSHSEIAMRLDLPLGTVKSHIRRSLKKLRGSLEL